jgi:guanylate kinase
MNLFPLVLSSPSGGGKTAIKNLLLKSDIFGFSITATTRPRREDEVNGRDYFFLSDIDFDKMVENNEFIEWANVHNYRYGTPKKSVMGLMEKGKIPIMTIDVVGAMNIKKIIPESLLIFIIPPNPSMLIERLKNRGEAESEIEIRMKTALKEINFAYKFDYIVINNDLQDCVNDIVSIVKSELKKTSRNLGLLDDFKSKMEKSPDGGPK